MLYKLICQKKIKGGARIDFHQDIKKRLMSSIVGGELPMGLDECGLSRSR